MNVASDLHRNRQPRASNGRRRRASQYGRISGWTGFGRDLQSVQGTRRIWALLTTMSVVLVVVFMGTSDLAINFTADIPDARTLATQVLPADTQVFAADGVTVLADLHLPGHRRYYQTLKDMGGMGSYLPEATIAIEDANFLHEPGVDAGGIVRAAWVDYRQHRNAQGASTITQQLVKLRLLNSQATVERKVREVYLATQVDKIFSKEYIMEQYLNTAFYGEDADGATAAARIYFHTDPTKLTLGQAAMLAGQPQNPSFNNPLVNWPGARARQRAVLDAMVREHMVTPEEADKAFAEDLSPPKHMFGPESHAPLGFASYIQDQLIATYGSAEAVLTGGYRVYTTLDMQLQQRAEKAMSEAIDQEQPRTRVSQGALVSINPATGAIVAMVGAAKLNTPTGQINWAITNRNPGSTMKMFTYTAAIAGGNYTMVTPIDDTRTIVHIPGGEDWEPRNFNANSYSGRCQLQACMGNSLNIPAVKVELGVGVPGVVNMARLMGAGPAINEGGNPHCPYGAETKEAAPLECYGLSLTLGSYNETPLKMASAASVLGAQGVLHKPHGIDRITTADGNEIYKADTKGQQVLPPQVAFIMESIMSDDNNRSMVFGPGSKLTLPGRRVGAKTGTSENIKDDWTIGYTPSLATAVWTGNPVNGKDQPMTSDAIEVAAPPWNAYMQSALDYMKKGDEWFAEPPGLVHVPNGGRTVYALPDSRSPFRPPPPLPPWVSSGSISIPSPILPQG